MIKRTILPTEEMRVQIESLRGPQGRNGTDGISPRVTVHGIDGGHRVSITDRNGTKTFDVMDGKSGTSAGELTVDPDGNATFKSSSFEVDADGNAIL